MARRANRDAYNNARVRTAEHANIPERGGRHEARSVATGATARNRGARHSAAKRPECNAVTPIVVANHDDVRREHHASG